MRKGGQLGEKSTLFEGGENGHVEIDGVRGWVAVAAGKNDVGAGENAERNGNR